MNKVLYIISRMIIGLGVGGLIALGLAACSHQYSDREIYQGVSKHTLKLLNPDNLESGGTGFQIITGFGHRFTLTNRHICEMTTKDYVIGEKEGMMRRLYIKAISEQTDLCLLEPMPGAGGIPLAASIEDKSEVFIVGHPYLDPTTFSKGFITGKSAIDILDHKEISLCKGPGYRVVEVNTIFGPMAFCVMHLTALWSDARTYPGNSGSPAVDSQMRLIGVLFAGREGGSAAFLVPLEDVRDFLSGI